MSASLQVQIMFRARRVQLHANPSAAQPQPNYLPPLHRYSDYYPQVDLGSLWIVLSWLMQLMEVNLLGLRGRAVGIGDCVGGAWLGVKGFGKRCRRGAARAWA